ncbi:efflux RND transporter periplasmic adaptor subunit [Iodidimonas sp. SYSU 1G8]|uniref:efflux RND transporter periplasmic adaptor subunit n=1 Tax=Iodidimonas sp. SYSU 1G8 TaxID=3133967 RepID=UPI0031FE6686
MRKWIVRSLVAAALIAVAGGVLWWRTGPVAVEVASPRIGPAVEAVYASGTVEPTVMMPIAPKLSGRLVQMLVDESASVTKGQKLAVFDNEEMAQSVREWEARVRFSQSQYDRAAELFGRGVGTGVARDSARNDLETAKASLARVRKQMSEMALTAPETGTIIRRDGEVGQVFPAGEALFWMSCCAPLRVSVEVDEEDIPRVKPGQQALIRSEAFPGKVLDGKVSEITPKGDPVARSFRVRIGLPEDTPLLIGMTADTNIVTATRQNALLLPAGSVNDGKAWVVRGDKLAQIPVTTGASGADWVEVTKGLTRKDKVVVNPADTLREGRRVTITVPGTKKSGP